MSRSPDVQCETILANGRRASEPKWLLHAISAEIVRFADTIPRSGRNRWSPPQLTDRCSSERDALEDPYVRTVPNDGSGRGLNYVGGSDGGLNRRRDRSA